MLTPDPRLQNGDFSPLRDPHEITRRTGCGQLVAEANYSVSRRHECGREDRQAEEAGTGSGHGGQDVRGSTRRDGLRPAQQAQKDHPARPSAQSADALKKALGAGLGRRLRAVRGTPRSTLTSTGWRRRGGALAAHGRDEYCVRDVTGSALPAHGSRSFPRFRELSAWPGTNEGGSTRHLTRCI